MRLHTHVQRLLDYCMFHPLQFFASQKSPCPLHPFAAAIFSFVLLKLGWKCTQSLPHIFCHNDKVAIHQTFSNFLYPNSLYLFVPSWKLNRHYSWAVVLGSGISSSLAKEMKRTTWPCGDTDWSSSLTLMEAVSWPQWSYLSSHCHAGQKSSYQCIPLYIMFQSMHLHLFSNVSFSFFRRKIGEFNSGTMTFTCQVGDP